MNKKRKWHRIGTLPVQRRIDSGCCLAVVLLRHMRVDPQGDVRLGVTKALADGDDIDPPSISWLACVWRSP
jgi:hypothetical protein